MASARRYKDDNTIMFKYLNLDYSYVFKTLGSRRGILKFLGHDRLYRNQLIKNDFVFICCEARIMLESVSMTESERSLRKRQHSLYKQRIVDSCTIQLNDSHRFKVIFNVFSKVIKLLGCQKYPNV